MSSFSIRIATLEGQSWMQRILEEGSSLPGKLAWVSVTVHNLPADAIPSDNALANLTTIWTS